MQTDPVRLTRTVEHGGRIYAPGDVVTDSHEAAFLLRHGLAEPDVAPSPLEVLDDTPAAAVASAGGDDTDVEAAAVDDEGGDVAVPDTIKIPAEPEPRSGRRRGTTTTTEGAITDG